MTYKELETKFMESLNKDDHGLRLIKQWRVHPLRGYRFLVWETLDDVYEVEAADLHANEWTVQKIERRSLLDKMYIDADQLKGRLLMEEVTYFLQYDTAKFENDIRAYNLILDDNHQQSFYQLDQLEKSKSAANTKRDPQADTSSKQYIEQQLKTSRNSGGRECRVANRQAILHLFYIQSYLLSSGVPTQYPMGLVEYMNGVIESVPACDISIVHNNE